MGRAWVVLLAALLVSGCFGVGDRRPEPIEGAASRATVDPAALSETGYERVASDTDRVRRNGTLSVSGDVQIDARYRAVATARRTVYRDDGTPPSVFAVYAVALLSPDDVDATVDPLGDRDPAAVVARSQDAYAGFADLAAAGGRTVRMLGEETTLTRYETTATTGGERVAVVVYVATVETGDVVRAVAVLPRSADDPTLVATLVAGVDR